ncbi:MAG: transglycosylase domain-containing protein, partial [Stellaceae bacterium]
PVHVREAVLAAEDRNFYSNPWFSFSGFARAVKNNMLGGITCGSVTVTEGDAGGGASIRASGRCRGPHTRRSGTASVQVIFRLPAPPGPC